MAPSRLAFKDWRLLVGFLVMMGAAIAIIAPVGLFVFNAYDQSHPARSRQEIARERFFKHPNKLLGMTRDEVVERLGEANNTGRGSEWELVFSAGATDEHYADNSRWLMLRLENGVVNDVRIRLEPREVFD